MKKSFVFLLLALALVVIVSPGIVGKLAEKSMDESLEWAATESREMKVTSQGFDRGWFSSEGQHRVELLDGDLRSALLLLAGDAGYDDLPDLIIDTRIDHGLVPVSSLGSDKGSLTPGLGSAVSTLHLEFPGGETVDLPGTIYSDVSLTGELRSNLVVEPGTFTQGNETIGWGDVDVRVTTHPSSNAVAFAGSIGELLLVAPGEQFTIDDIAFDGEQRQTRFGITTGDVDIAVGSLVLPAGIGANEFGPFHLTSDVGLDDDKVSGRSTIELGNIPFGDFGPSTIRLDVAIEGVDAAAVGRISDAVNSIGSFASGDALMAAIDADLTRVLAGGFELRVDRLDIATPPGTVAVRLNAEVAPTDVDRFVMTSLLTALDAELEISIPAELYDYAVSLDPQVSTAVGMGFLRKNGDVYELQATYRDALLTVNGAPMPGLIPALN